MSRTYHVYILASLSRALYTGVTGDLPGRVWRHKQRTGRGFTARYNVTRLVWYESTSDVRSAIAREKQIKGWTRKRKLELVEAMNPTWEDLAEQRGFMDITRYRSSW